MEGKEKKAKVSTEQQMQKETKRLSKGNNLKG